MPRNSQGLYTLPLPPVQPGNLVESQWANATLDDLAAAMTGSLPRNGSAPMTGPLQLSADPIVAARQATTKAYVDQFMSFGSGMFVGSFAYAPLSTEPAGWLLCDGRAVSRTVYSELFSAIGVMFGSGDGSTTFNLPSQSGRYLRGGAAGELMGQLLGGTFAAHTHPLSDPGHSHGVSQAAHSHSIVTGGHSHTAYQAAHDHTITTGSHGHGVNDPGHTHAPMNSRQAGDGGSFGAYASSGANIGTSVPSSGTGISIAAVGNLGGYADARQPAVTVNAAGDLGGYTSTVQPAVSVSSAATGQTVGAAGDAENRPASIVCNLFIKAQSDGPGTTVVTGLDTSDPDIVSIDVTNPVVPELVIHSNIAFGTIKLDAGGKIPLAQMPAGSVQNLGFFDASGGQNPSQAYPGNTFVSGDTYTVSVGGNILVFDPVTLVSSVTPVVAGNLLQYVTGSVTNPTGWYYVIQAIVVAASQVTFAPSGTIVASNVQAAIQELDSETQASLALKADTSAVNAALALKQDAITAVTKDVQTGGAFIPAGTTAERPASPTFGQQRANSTTLQQEWWNGSAWVPMGGGATGGTNNPFIYENDITVTADYTITSGKNAMSAGPITINNGVTVTVPNGSVWSIV